MPHHRLAHLNHQDVRIDELTVHSYEMGLYLVEADFDGRKGFIVNDDNQPQRFHSVEQVKQSLSDCTVHSAWLVHQSAYDEMCGGPEKTDNTLKLPICFKH